MKVLSDTSTANFRFPNNIQIFSQADFNEFVMIVNDRHTLKEFKPKFVLSPLIGFRISRLLSDNDL